ncbi:putative C6 transcription factor [Aspergillus uvarum CBS 121591]|uniref:Putative C6 transcription factor n=1 Tax=Aspergillus uvarum CBS 121591 TaxID=1448315 RepID=A0A319C5K1_9EURO|nr:putative C6 transcription factor [Aspergillus uvarum CBS 121591]PYH81126.1 putative C6 transcription factor [Aspergillus uvarum CBS 121591]
MHANARAILPAPAGADPCSKAAPSSPTTMSYTCRTCVRRKVKCDRLTPRCSSCRRGNHECSYQVPFPPTRKRKASEDLADRVARYERILRQHGLLDADTQTRVSGISPDPISFHYTEPAASTTGRVLAAKGTSRYVSGHPWNNFGEEEVRRVFEEEEQEQREMTITSERLVSDPLTDALMGSRRSLLQYHPTHTEALLLWHMHVESVEPFCKILHIPSTSAMIERVSHHPELASDADECLVFAIYQFAVYAMTDEDCEQKLGQPRSTLSRRYHSAAQQALVNAAFLKTSDIQVLQALVLFLLSSRQYYDSQTYWILTGVAVRIGQRIGLHQDGEKLGMSPFDVQMRRRLFYQLIPLDGRASQMAGTVVFIPPDAWDTQLPRNINDEQIWPGMTEAPREQQGATQMIFCLSRACVGRFFASMSPHLSSTGPWKFDSLPEAESVIGAAEREVEDKYIRYCDIVDPLHFLTVGLARAGITAMRLRVRLTRVRNQTATEAEMREVFHLAQKILDTDAAVSAHSGLERYRWHVRPFFLWGTFDSFISVLTTLWTRASVLSPVEVEGAWKKVEQVYCNHDELLGTKPLYVALRRLTLKAWDAHAPSGTGTEPGFIATARSLRMAKSKAMEGTPAAIRNAKDDRDDPAISRAPSATDLDAMLGPVAESIDGEMGDGINFDAVDWAFWDQLIQYHQGYEDG